MKLRDDSKRKFVLDRRNTRIPANPPLEFAKMLVEKARGFDEIESIGGGSTIDVGKYVARELDIPHTAIPTTAGTGAEVTRFAVFMDNGKKVSLEDDRLIPDSYILKPELVVSLPQLQTAATGLDALSQAIESYWSPEATRESRSYASRAFRGVMKNLKDSYDYPTSEVLRMKMLEAANYSGQAINITRTSICHAISYPLTIHYGIPHGIACAHTLPFFMEYFGFKPIVPWKVRRLLKGMVYNIPKGIDIDLVAKEALESVRSKNTPREVTYEVIKKSLLADNG